MILVGVDVASEKHDVSIMRDTGEVIRDNLTIPNKESGYKSYDELPQYVKDEPVKYGLKYIGTAYKIKNIYNNSTTNIF